MWEALPSQRDTFPGPQIFNTAPPATALALETVSIIGLAVPSRGDV